MARQRTERRGRSQRNQRLHGRGRQSGGGLHRSLEGRWLDRLRLLDLLRRLPDGDQHARPRASRTGNRTGWRREWGWAWPHNRRILYNRASADPEGKPWSERKKLRLVGRRARKSGPATIRRISSSIGPPSYRPSKDARGKDTISGIDPFIMQADGKGWIYRPAGLQDGPLPTHYEPQESVDPKSSVWTAVQSDREWNGGAATTRIIGRTTIRAFLIC